MKQPPWLTDILARYDRVAIAGGPRFGKTTLRALRKGLAPDVVVYLGTEPHALLDGTRQPGTNPRGGESVTPMAEQDHSTPPEQAAPHAERWTHKWVTQKEHAARYGSICRIVRRPMSGPGSLKGWHGAMGMSNTVVTVEFADGTRVQAQRWCIRSLGAIKPGGGARKGDGYGKRRVGP